MIIFQNYFKFRKVTFYNWIVHCEEQSTTSIQKRKFETKIRAMETSTSETDFVRSIECNNATTESFTKYREFLENFAKNVDPTDQLPVRVPNYTLEECEISGAVIDWMIQYLGDK